MNGVPERIKRSFLAAIYFTDQGLVLLPDLLIEKILVFSGHRLFQRLFRIGYKTEIALRQERFKLIVILLAKLKFTYRGYFI